jgi:hypothetical protein
LSENELGYLPSPPSAPTSPIFTQQDLLTSLSRNTTLEYLSLDMNPLSREFVDVMHQALQHNTTIRRMCLLTISIPLGLLEQIEYLVALNRAGRGALREGVPCQIMPQLLSTVSAQPTLLYGMLTEVPHLWM